jgi:hypothetical protein
MEKAKTRTNPKVVVVTAKGPTEERAKVGHWQVATGVPQSSFTSAILLTVP